MANEAELRQAMVQASLELVALGLNRGTSGNVGVRCGDGLLVTPSGVPASELNANSMVRLAANGDVIGPGIPSSEWRFHRDILMSRPELHAVVHVHSPFATTLACLRARGPAVSLHDRGGRRHHHPLRALCLVRHAAALRQRAGRARGPQGLPAGQSRDARRRSRSGSGPCSVCRGGEPVRAILAGPADRRAPASVGRANGRGDREVQEPTAGSTNERRTGDDFLAGNARGDPALVRWASGDDRPAGPAGAASSTCATTARRMSPGASATWWCAARRPLADRGLRPGAGALRHRHAPDRQFARRCDRGFEVLAASRPTAVNLFWALERMRVQWRVAAASHRDGCPAARCWLRPRRSPTRTSRSTAPSAQYGAALLADGARVLTHCNAGALATAGRHRAGRDPHGRTRPASTSPCIADETRPLLQGARLTAWELMQDGIPVTLITDNMAGHHDAAAARSTA